MARLPTFVDLGQGPSARSGRPIADVDVSGFARGVRDLGAGLEGAARTLFAEARRDKAETDDIETARARAAWSTGRVQLESSFKPDDPNYEQWGERYGAEAERIRQEAAAGIRDPQRRERFLLETQPQVAVGRARIDGMVQSRQRDAGIAGLNQTLSDIREAALKAQDAKERERLIQSGSEAVQNAIARGFLTQEQGRQLGERWRQDYARAGLAMMPPEERAAALRGPARDMDQVVDRIIGIESGGDPNARNPNSSATGAGQFIAGTWLSMIQQYRPDLAAGKSQQEILALRNNPAISREMTRRYAEQNATFLGARGIAATPGNIYLAHFLGPAGAAQVLTADPSTPVVNIVGQDAVNANRSILADKTAGEVAAWAARRMGGDAPTVGQRRGTEPMDRGAMLANILATDERARMLADAEAEIAQNMRRAEQNLREQRVQIAASIEDDVASIERTGQGAPPERLSREAVAAALGEEGVRAWELRRARARRVFEATEGIETLPEGEIERRLQALQPRPGAPGFVEDTRAYEKARQRADAVRQARERDPARAVEAIPSVAEARRSAQYQENESGRTITPESAQAIIRARLAAQAQLGIREPHAITVAEGREIARQLRFIGEDDGAGLERFLSALRTTYGPYANDVLVSALQIANVNRDLGVAAVAVLNRLAQASSRQEQVSALEMLSAPVPMPRPSDAEIAGTFAEPYDLPTNPYAPSPYPGAAGERGRAEGGPPPATYDAADLRTLWEGRGNPEIVGAFEQKYGRGSASHALRDLMRRLGGTDNDR